ncbi:MAG TPA: hypothetical protein VF703_16575 [Pyrinomonadaceae bacterium]|jgi:hypothetical protein
MLPIPALNFGYNDAENYRRKENKELFNQIFVRTEELDNICQENIFFLMGDKGTGKTAYAVYLSNNYYKETLGSIKYIRETEYQKFISMKLEKHLALSDYTNIWKVILYLLMSQVISERESTNFLFRAFSKFRILKEAIDEYYANAFSPEIIYAMQFVEQSKLAAELIFKYAKASGEETASITFSESRFQTNLLYIQKKFEDALTSLKLKDNHILFIDGIDIRPNGVPYDDYLECVKGLAHAVWSINNDFFSNIKDSKGRMRVVLLVRPDIFNSLGMQNQNNKIRDNSVLLNWQTTYQMYRHSSIFFVADRLLAWQQTKPLDHGETWDYYFPYKAVNLVTNARTDSSFITFLRFSYYRPRDIVSMFGILQENFIQQQRPITDVFSEEDFNNPEFRRKYSDYLLGEVRDNLSFYYTHSNYELFLKFFEFLYGKQAFKYDEYLQSFSQLEKFISRNSIVKPSFFDTADVFLQFLYELNVICYQEHAGNEIFSRWCFRERSSANFSPKVKTNERYLIHYGLAKALNTGRHLRIR